MGEVQAALWRAQRAQLRVVEVAGDGDTHGVRADGDVHMFDVAPDVFAVGGDEVLRGVGEQFIQD